jgi:hypothetical protein
VSPTWHAVGDDERETVLNDLRVSSDHRKAADAAELVHNYST